MNVQSIVLSQLGQAALAYAEQGFAVFPLRPRGKEPLTKHGFKDATDDEAQIRRWWAQSPSANIGIASGCEHGIAAIVVAGPEGEKRLALFGKLPATARSKTEDGWQYFFALPDGCGPVPSSTRKGLDIRGDGGHVVAPPSLRNGKAYEWDEKSPRQFAEASQGLLDFARNREGVLKALDGPTALEGGLEGKDKGMTGEGRPEHHQGRDAPIAAVQAVRTPTTEPSNERAAYPKNDTAGAIAFLKALRPAGPWVLTAIVPDRLTTTKSFETSDEAGAMAFITERNQAGENLYYTLNSCGRPISKPAKADMTGAVALHVDSDPRGDETIEAAKARIQVAYDAHDPPPSVIVDSGNGLQALWMLEREFIFPKLASARVAPIEDRNRALALELGAPAGTHNADRLLRLPGTINWPTKTKRAAGRTVCISSVVKLSDARYPLERFPAAGKSPAGQGAKKNSAGKSGVAGRDDTRSGKAWRAGAALKADGATYEQMREALLKHQDREIREWANTKGMDNDEREMHRIFNKAGGGDDEAAVRLEDFVAYMQSHDYVYMPGGNFWPAARVDARLPPVPLVDKSGGPVINDKREQKTIKASAWLAKHAPVEQMTWAPGMLQLIRGKLISDGGWIDRKGVTVLNLYRPPTIEPGDATKAGPWIEHVKQIYPDEADHIIKFLAHRVQRPHEKINHGLVLGGSPSIGKDTLLEPVKHAVGAWNFGEVSPQHMLGRFNGFLKSVVLRISEAKDMGEFDRFKFYAHMKVYMAAPPDVLRVDEKNLREHSVVNVCGVVMTTNHKTDGIFLPADDRRHCVAWSDAKQEDFTEAYWNDRWRWYESGGFGHVATYLAELDLSGFNPKAPPPKTPAFWAIVDANRATEDAELADVLDKLERPDAVTLDRLVNEAGYELGTWLRDRKNRRAIPHRLEQCGYIPVRNDAADDGLFKINGRRQVIYAKATLCTSERLRAARALTSR